MMRVGIITFVDYSNYGNRLQNYALQCFLEQYNVEVETILNEKYYDCKYLKGEYVTRLSNLVKAVFWRFYDWMHHDVHAMGYIMKSDPLKKKRIEKNLDFSKRYIKETDFIIREGNFHKKKMERYDYIFSGSDQVWNPTMAGASEIFFMTYVPKQKRIAFSASVGLDRIPDKYKKQWKKYIEGMNYISVREESAKKIVEEISDKKAEVLLDPTMLIEKSTWEDLIKDRKMNVSSKYIMTYVLGEFDEKGQNALDKLVHEENLELVEFNNRKYEDIFCADVIDFVKYIANADCIITDSFHACVFSILFKKEFYVVKRSGEFSNIYSRIEDLLKRFCLEERAVESVGEIKRRELSDEQKKYIDVVLKKEREKADIFVKEVLSQ